jgi:hypothetical protein
MDQRRRSILCGSIVRRGASLLLLEVRKKIVTENCLALKIVESKALQRLAMYLNPSFEMPSRPDLTKNLIPALKGEIVHVIDCQGFSKDRRVLLRSFLF